jgi:hypothetical protein
LDYTPVVALPDLETPVTSVKAFHGKCESD